MKGQQMEYRCTAPRRELTDPISIRQIGQIRPIGLSSQLPAFHLRSGITLIEVLLALGLTVVVTGLIGGLIQLYQGHLEIARDNVRQARLARAVLTMIADDIRGTLRMQSNDDAKTLEKFLTSSAANKVAGAAGGAAGGGGKSGAGGGQTTGGGGTQGGQTGQTGSAGQTGTGAGATAGTTPAEDPSTATTAAAPLPPGIFGSETSIEIDISRPPRPDEYVAEMKNVFESKLTDIPSDTKTVSYYVQAPQANGIQDPLNNVAGTGSVSSGGLVRRSLDRAITRWTYEQGQTDQMSNTGQLLAAEIVALSFSYFDGLQWTTTWDSSAQGMPWAVQITIAMQHAKQARTVPLAPGMSLQSILALPRSETGIETYSLLALVPGAQLLTTPAEKSATESSTSSPTSALGF